MIYIYAVGIYTDTGWYIYIYAVGIYTDTGWYICGGHIHGYWVVYMRWAYTRILDGIYAVGIYTDTG